jgi:hypothetical protein
MTALRAVRFASVRGERDSGPSSLLSLDSYRPIMISGDGLLSHIDALYRYGIVLSGNAAVASDLVQEAYVRALNFRNKLRHDNNIKSWMFTILRNIWLNQLRKERNFPDLAEQDNQTPLPKRFPALGGKRTTSLLDPGINRFTMCFVL